MNESAPIDSSAVPWRTQIAVYGVGLFTTSVFYVASVVIPLFAYTMNPSPFVFGLVFAAAHVLPLLFSIHAGALMDRLGARRVVLVCTTAAVVLPLFYPLSPGIWALIVLQMFLGLAESMGWLGAQTMIGQYMHGRTTYAGRLSFVVRFGQLVAPPMAGITWDLAGVWGAFILMSLWGLGSVVCALLLPVQPARPASGALGRPHTRFRSVMPRWSDYRLAFGLLATPSVAIIVALGGLMHMGNSVQGSFYVAWLTEMGIAGTAIGFLITGGAIGAAIFSLLTVPLMRYVAGFWIVLVSLWLSVVLICITPLLGTYLMLQIAMFFRSGMNGLAQPLVITLVLRGAGRSNQGKAVGLRGTANRMASILAPIAMGAIGELVGVRYAFYLVGAIASLAMAWIAIYLIRHPELTRKGED